MRHQFFKSLFWTEMFGNSLNCSQKKLSTWISGCVPLEKILHLHFAFFFWWLLFATKFRLLHVVMPFLKFHVEAYIALQVWVGSTYLTLGSQTWIFKFQTTFSTNTVVLLQVYFCLGSAWFLWPMSSSFIFSQPLSWRLELDFSVFHFNECSALKISRPRMSVNGAWNHWNRLDLPVWAACMTCSNVSKCHKRHYSYQSTTPAYFRQLYPLPTFDYTSIKRAQLIKNPLLWYFLVHFEHNCSITLALVNFRSLSYQGAEMYCWPACILYWHLFEVLSFPYH